MARRIVFDDWRSWIHFALGFATAVSTKLPFLLPKLIVMALFISFMYWEIAERENKLCKLGDFIEFLMGFVAGFLVSSLL